MPTHDRETEPTGTVLQNQPYQRLRHDDLVQPGNMWVQELAVVVDLAREVVVVLLGRLEDHLVLLSESAIGNMWTAHLGAIGELVGREIDLAKAALADQPPQGVVPHRLEVRRREFTAARWSVSRCARRQVRSGWLTREAACRNWRATVYISYRQIA